VPDHEGGEFLPIDQGNLPGGTFCLRTRALIPNPDEADSWGISKALIF
jgi:hypothetical protein